MIPTEGTINIIGNSNTLNTTTVGAFSLTGYTFSGSYQIVVRGSPDTTAFANLNSTTGIFLTGGTNVSPFSACTRVIAQRSPVGYVVTGITYSSPNVTLNLASSLPVAPLIGEVIHITNSNFNGTYTLIGSPTVSALQFNFGTTDPGIGFNGSVVYPGIHPTNLTGYYTINRPATAAVSNGTIVGNSQARNPFVVPTGTTHVIPTSGTANFANILIDGIGSVSIPCNQLLSLKNLKGGSSFMASGTTSGTDVISLSYCTRSWP